MFKSAKSKIILDVSCVIFGIIGIFISGLLMMTHSIRVNPIGLHIFMFVLSLTTLSISLPTLIKVKVKSEEV